MGLMAGVVRALANPGALANVGRVGVEVAEVFRPNATRQLELGHDAFSAVQGAYAAEFQYGRGGWFDSFVNALNRLPRPVLALATPALFAYAMVDPAGFALRMRGLAEVPEPLWWLLGAVVAFYFGARETHYLRSARPAAGGVSAPVSPVQAPRAEARRNPALAEWMAEENRGG